MTDALNPGDVAHLKRGYYPEVKTPSSEQIIASFNTEPFITKESKIIAVGSCFAMRVIDWVVANGYHCLPDEFGRVYTPKNMRQIIQSALDPQHWNPVRRYVEFDGEFFDPYRVMRGQPRPVSLGHSEEEAQQTLDKHTRHTRQLLCEADVLILTFGLTEHWRHCDDQTAWCEKPFDGVLNHDIHELHSLSFQEASADIDLICELVKKHNPEIKIIMTVSPVALYKTFRKHLGAYIATISSKSILYTATFETVEKYDHVFYMPSFEIAKADPANHFHDDGRHVNHACVRKIMEAFESLYVVSTPGFHQNV